jgi:hypothetical protein
MSKLFHFIFLSHGIYLFIRLYGWERKHDRGDRRNKYRILVEKAEEKIATERRGDRW